MNKKENKIKRKKDENKKQLKWSNIEKGARHPLRFAGLCATQTCQLRAVSHIAGEAESAWKAQERVVDSGVL